MPTPPLQLSVTCARSLPGRSRAESEFASSPNMQTGGCAPAAVLDGAPPGPSPARAPGKQQRPGSDSARRSSARRPRGTPTAPAPRPHAARTIPKASHLAVRRDPPTAALCIRPSARLPAHSRIPPIAGSPALSITVGPAHRRAPHPANRAPRPPSSQSSNPRAPHPSRRRAPCSWTLRVRGATPPFLGQRGAGLAPRGLYRCVRGICVLPTAPALGRSPDVPEPSGCVRCSRCPGPGAEFAGCVPARAGPGVREAAGGRPSARPWCCGRGAAGLHAARPGLSTPVPTASALPGLPLRASSRTSRNPRHS